MKVGIFKINIPVKLSSYLYQNMKSDVEILFLVITIALCGKILILEMIRTFHKKHESIVVLNGRKKKNKELMIPHCESAPMRLT